MCQLAHSHCGCLRAQNRVLSHHYHKCLHAVSGLNATDKMPMYEILLTFVWGVWGFRSIIWVLAFWHRCFVLSSLHTHILSNYMYTFVVLVIRHWRYG